MEQNLEDEVRIEENQDVKNEEESIISRKLTDSETSDKGNSVEDKQQTNKILDLKLDRNDVKCKSLTKKNIRLPRYTKKQTEKTFSSTMGHKGFNRKDQIKNVYSVYEKRSNFHTMKSMSPTKNLQQNRLHMSMDGLTMVSSAGFKTDFSNSKRRNLGNNYKSLLTFQRVGPGSYNLPVLIGEITHETNKKNNPKYSIGKTNKFSMIALDKEQMKMNIGQDSPGVGRYSPDSNKLRKSSPNTKIGREKRFMELKQTKDLMKEIPHSYFKQDSESVGLKQNAHMHNTISSTFGNFYGRNNSSDQRTSFKNKYHNKQYYRELER
jgi:hypothetical protein